MYIGRKPCTGQHFSERAMKHRREAGFSESHESTINVHLLIEFAKNLVPSGFQPIFVS